MSFEFFKSGKYPSFSEIPHYLKRRLLGNSRSLSVGKDRFNNSSLRIAGRFEETFKGFLPHEFIWSNEGRQVILQNRGTLKRIMNGEYPEECIGEGNEGRAYRIMLNNDTGGKTPYVIKYYFPSIGGDAYYTPGIDQMRIMQYINAHRIVPNLQMAIPIFASLDLTLAPYIDGADYSFFDSAPQYLSEESYQWIFRIHEIIANEISFYLECEEDQGAFDTLLVSKRMHLQECLKKSNWLVKLPEFEKLNEIYRFDEERILQLPIEEQIQMVVRCFVLIEAMVGFDRS